VSKISVIGLGKLGAPLAAVLSSKGHQVLGLDLNPDTIEQVNLGKAPVDETGLQELMTKYPFQATGSYAELVKRSSVSFVLVPTPSLPDKQFTSRYVIEVIEELGYALRQKKRNHLVVICSTVMPGETNGPIKDALERTSGKIVGKELGLCYSPEFIALGSVIHNMLNPDMVIIGESDKKAGDKLEKVLRSISKAEIHRMNIVNAEVAKISVNAFVTMKISYANTLAEICEAVPEADAEVVTSAIGSDSRIGHKYLKPATAFGGPCFPRDTKAFSAFARSVGTSAPLADASDEVNDRQTDRLVALARRYAVGSNASIFGLAYKPDTAITEESPGMKLAAKLIEEGFNVWAYDPVVRSADHSLPLHHSAAPAGALLNSSVAFVMTPWAEFSTLIPAGLSGHNLPLVIVDCWNITDEGPWDNLHVHRIGKG